MEYIEPYWNYLISAVIVVAVLILSLLVYRALASQIRGRRGSRLGITEYHEIDKSRRLVMVRRDGVEHLLLIGGMQDIVIESGIGSDVGRPSADVRASRLEAVPAEEHPPVPMRPAPRPAVFGERKPGLRPVERDEPRLGETRNFEPEGKS